MRKFKTQKSTLFKNENVSHKFKDYFKKCVNCIEFLEKSLKFSILTMLHKKLVILVLLILLLSFFVC